MRKGDIKTCTVCSIYRLCSHCQGFCFCNYNKAGALLILKHMTSWLTIVGFLTPFSKHLECSLNPSFLRFYRLYLEIVFIYSLACFFSSGCTQSKLLPISNFLESSEFRISVNITVVPGLMGWWISEFIFHLSCWFYTFFYHTFILHCILGKTLLFLCARWLPSTIALLIFISSSISHCSFLNIPLLS